MRKFFIDAGGHLGESIIRFKSLTEYSPDFLIYSFEANKNLISKYLYKEKDAIIVNKAVWINDGQINFYNDVRKIRVGSSIFKEKHRVDKEHPELVDCFDLSKWILDNFSLEDYIILKMDIEGAEYDVLWKMIKDGSINYIDKMHTEWHYNKIGRTKEEHDRLLEKLKEINPDLVGEEFYYYAERIEKEKLAK